MNLTPFPGRARVTNPKYMSDLSASEIQSRSDLLEWSTATGHRHFDAYTHKLCRRCSGAVVPIDVEAEHPDILFPIVWKDPGVAAPATFEEARTWWKRRVIRRPHKELLVLTNYAQHDCSLRCHARATQA
jgi:hypothetical protein